MRLPLVRAEQTGAALDQLKARASYTSRPATTTISNKKGVNGQISRVEKFGLLETVNLSTFRRKITMRKLFVLSVAVLTVSTATWAGPKGAGAVSFDMLVSGGAAACLPYATGTVTITPTGPVEYMDVNVSGLPPNTEFDFFVIQLPIAPFGLSWYQGDIETDAYGQGSQRFIGRFSIETFTVAPGSGPAPVVHDDGPFPDADQNPAVNPLHMYHLGLWFGSPEAAAGAGCASTVTPFNGDHQAGIQVLNTRNYPDDQGPLRQVTP